MKKYLFMWSVAIGLLVTAQAQALTCEEETTCEKMGYTTTTEQVGAFGTDYTCTACPLDGAKWSCASIAPVVNTGGDDVDAGGNEDVEGKGETIPLQQCEAYPYTCQEVVELYPTESGYKHYACPPSKDTTDNACANSSPDTKFMQKSVACPTGYSTERTRKCEKEEQTVTYTNCYYAWIYSSGGPMFDSTGWPIISEECLSEPPANGKFQAGSIPNYEYQSWCKNSNFVSQFSSNQITEHYNNCIANNTQERIGWRKYRCQKGMSGGKPCLSSFTVIGYQNRPHLEPCAVLYGATPDNECLYH